MAPYRCLRNDTPGRLATMAQPLVSHFSGAYVEVARRVVVERPEIWARLEQATDYLIEFGQQAVAPDVEWYIAQSAFGPHSGEIRWPDPETQQDHPNDAWRGLFVAAVDYSWILFTVLGNKAAGSHRGNAWYDLAVPQSDQIARAAAKHLDLSSFPPE